MLIRLPLVLCAVGVYAGFCNHFNIGAFMEKVPELDPPVSHSSSIIVMPVSLRRIIINLEPIVSLRCSRPQQCIIVQCAQLVKWQCF